MASLTLGGPAHEHTWPDINVCGGDTLRIIWEDTGEEAWYRGTGRKVTRKRGRLRVEYWEALYLDPDAFPDWLQEEVEEPVVAAA